MAVGDSTTVTRTTATRAGIAQRLEHQPSKLRVASSNLVSRSSPASSTFLYAVSDTSALGMCSDMCPERVDVFLVGGADIHNIHQLLHKMRNRENHHG